MNQEIQIFLEQCSKIRLWGEMSAERKYASSDMTISYFLPVEEGISAELSESNFEISIGISFAESQISYKLTLGKLKNEFIRSEKYTQERYGMVYQIPPKQIIEIVEEHITMANQNQFVEKKLISGLKNMLERNIPDILINGYYGYRFTIYYPSMSDKERKKYDEETNVYRTVRYNWELNDLRRTLERISHHKELLSFIPYDQDLANYGLPSLEMISDILTNSKVFIVKNENLKKVFNGELSIEIMEDKLFLGFEFINRIA